MVLTRAKLGFTKTAYVAAVGKGSQTRQRLQWFGVSASVFALFQGPFPHLQESEIKNVKEWGPWVAQ